MKKGVHYEQSYALVASWSSIRLALAIAMAHNWASTQVDYVLGFPDTIPTRNGRELGEIWVSKVGTNF